MGLQERGKQRLLLTNWLAKHFIYMTSSFRATLYTAFLAGLFLMLAVGGVGSVVVVHAQEVPPPADVCANVPGDQTAEPCADVVCATDGGTWNGDSCDLPPVPPPVEGPPPPPTDVCANVPGDQTAEPCADVVCATDGGTWNGDSCDLPADPPPEEPPSPPPTCRETEHLDIENNVCASNATPPQTEVATSTNGTGGLFGGTIDTGDAMATTTVKNELNINITNPDSAGESNSSVLTSENTNEGEVMSGSLTVSTTGENEADGGVSLATISTGMAVSTASVINVVNTNLFNSEGLVLFINQLFGGGLDMREYDLSYFFGAPVDCDTNPMILSCRNSSDLNVFNTNMATVTNSVIVRSSTGTNTASSTGDGSALIDTGDAYAAANVLNLVNTNLINSNYLLVSFNNFGNLGGDITLPNADFFKQLLAHGGVLAAMNFSSLIKHSA